MRGGIFVGEQKPVKTQKHICAGLLAHVDAGKTTLSEAILYETGTIRRLGRVDSRDAYLDTYALERARGITIFSKQAEFALGDRAVTLLDTPGHVDFSAEMERTLQVLDCAVLVISGADGVQGHTETLWRLLKRYGIPTFLFINKMDQAGTDRQRLLEDVQAHLDESCLDFGELTELEGEPEALSPELGISDDFLETLAMCDEQALEEYLETGTVSAEAVRRMIGERRVFPCYFGSALKLAGVDGLLAGLERWLADPVYADVFGAKVYKISRDEQGNRLTHLKITGGSLKVKDLITVPGEAEGEKVNQIRIYSGSRYELANEAAAGTVCAVTGLTMTRPGQGLGAQEEAELPVLEPVLTYQVVLPEGCDVHKMLRELRQLEEEEPQLHIVWNETLGEIHAQVMGEVQMEVLKSLVQERFGQDISFDAGNIVYKETIVKPVEGVGHFEPLRHYAEVHLLMEPGEPGSGLQFETCCSEDALDRNWQRLILAHLEEKRHVGVLCGAEITDMRVTLIAGRAHQKHTEGGDFRQATYRALRQGLRETECRLLEPYYDFRLELPQECVGRAMADLERMHGSFEALEQDGENMLLTGSAPVALMRDYQREVISYSRGRGRLSCTLKGYFPCHNEAEIVAARGYDPEADLDNPTGSVFCAHGAGFVVPWYQVKEYMQVESPLKEMKTGAKEAPGDIPAGSAYVSGNRAGLSAGGGPVSSSASFGAEEKELEAIFTRTYGESRRRLPAAGGPRQVVYDPETSGSAAAGGRAWNRGPKERVPVISDPVRSQGKPGYMKKQQEPEIEYLLVDGYNILYAWEDLRELMKVTVDGARHRLMDILCNYQGYRRCRLIVVFDAYKVSGGTGSAQDYHNIHVVYTKEAETADQYIEKFAHDMGRRFRVTVATSDGLEQLIIRGQGCILMSAADLREDVERVGRQIEEDRGQLPKPGKNYLFKDVDADLAAYLEQVRLGKTGADPAPGSGSGK
ncbi:MAG: TetM/TetW/TetO/TetS family tetracycline resistance ribosomal protection protein [Eubacteriales bacterium]|nr:TetM/TetW/TetO/TetS family tetracycline resistance ribosomal protection protein [Eubacteriales bacterium]